MIRTGERFQALFRGVIISGLLIISGCAGIPVGYGTPDKMPTRDVGTVDAACSQVAFIVSLNDDDDDVNRKLDLSEGINPTTEDNLREFVFSHPSADQVYISNIIVIATNMTAVGSRVRGYSTDRSTPLTFDTKYPTSTANPFKMYLEGISTSGVSNDIGFEYQYYKDQTPVCGGGAQGTVVSLKARLVVARGRGANFSKNNKMLITAQGKASAVVVPANTGQKQWSYDIAGNIRFSSANQLLTDVIAQTNPTMPNHLDQDQLRFKVKVAGQVIEAHFPINITSPMHTSIRGRRRGIDYRSNWIDANKGRFTLMPNIRIRYLMLDQFRASINESAYGTRVPQIKENIGNVLTSPIQKVQTWINAPPPTGLSWTSNWRDKPRGRFTDRIQARGVNKDLFVVTTPSNRRMFHQTLQNTGGVLMEVTPPASHIWLMSVNGAGVVNGTLNTFSSRVIDTQVKNGGTQIRIRSTYRANPQ